MGYAAAIPIATVALCHGMYAGFAVGLFSHPFNLLMGRLYFGEWESNPFREAYLFAWLAGIVAGGLIGRLADLGRRHRLAAERLSAALCQLRGDLADGEEGRSLIAICAHCKKIRDEYGRWQEAETYLREHHGLCFTHGLCPDCVRAFYGEYLSSSPDGSQGIVSNQLAR